MIATTPDLWQHIKLQTGNSKLGTMATWSLPAGITCPGKTAICASKCYAKKGHFMYKHTQEAFRRNLEAVMTDPHKWFEVMKGELSRLPDGFLVRIHVSGDFFSADYAKLWHDLAVAFPRLKFGAYTRSWIVPAIRPTLEAMADLRNVTLWASVDRDNVKAYTDLLGPWGLPLGRSAVMMTPDDSYIVQALLDAGMDRRNIIVFRTSRRGFMKQVAGAVVCPIEQANPIIATHGKPATEGQIVMNCSKCRLCYDKAPGKRIKV